jgi:uracil-DNA glycosylase
LSARAEPARDCPLCPRLVAYRATNAAEEPGWFNGPAPSFGPEDARLLIVGLAPGRTGANRTGRPFTGDFAGDLLYQTLADLGLSHGDYAGHADDGLMLKGVMITNAVRCAPPANKPTPQEISICNGFLAARIAALPSLRCIFALGRIAHEAVLTAHGLRKAKHAFVHGAVHELQTPGARQTVLVDSYHCSRYNQNTRVLTPAMFTEALAKAAALAMQTEERTER